MAVITNFTQATLDGEARAQRVLAAISGGTMPPDTLLAELVAVLRADGIQMPPAPCTRSFVRTLQKRFEVIGPMVARESDQVCEGR